jgi:4-carboxymuconolactone decarboxylase
MATLPDAIDTLQGPEKAIYDDIIQRRAAEGVHDLGPYVPLSNYPELSKYIERLGFFYKYESELPRELYQFVVLEVGRRSGVEFVWRDHLAPARAAGVPEAVISAAASGSADLPSPYHLIWSLMDWAFRFDSIPRDVQDDAVAAFGTDGVLEIVTLCGYYTMIGMVNACFDVPLPGAAATQMDHS